MHLSLDRLKEHSIILNDRTYFGGETLTGGKFLHITYRTSNGKCPIERSMDEKREIYTIEIIEDEMFLNGKEEKEMVLVIPSTVKKLEVKRT